MVVQPNCAYFGGMHLRMTHGQHMRAKRYVDEQGRVGIDGGRNFGPEIAF